MEASGAEEGRTVTGTDLAPNSTAVRTALWRALHTELDAAPHVIDDRLGLLLAEPDPDWRRRPDMNQYATPGVRASIVARARFIEDLVAERAEDGVTQYVLLGAGLDTFVQRRPEIASCITVFEVDQPGPQAWKRQRLIDLGFGIPQGQRLVPVDFENQSWWEQLLDNGFDTSAPAVVSSLGVSMYLTEAAVDATLARVAGWPGGGEIVFDYAEPPYEEMSEQSRAARQALRERVAAVGEPFLSALVPEALHARLAELGYAQIEDLAPLDLAERFLGPEIAAAASAAGAGGRGGGHVLFART